MPELNHERHVARQGRVIQDMGGECVFADRPKSFFRSLVQRVWPAPLAHLDHNLLMAEFSFAEVDLATGERWRSFLSQSQKILCVPLLPGRRLATGRQAVGERLALPGPPGDRGGRAVLQVVGVRDHAQRALPGGDRVR